MASNQISKQQTKSGQSNRQEKRRSAGGSSRESNEEHGFVGDLAEHASDYVSRGASQVRELTRDHEGSAVLVALVAGFGIGALIGSALAPRQRPKSWRDRLMAEGIGRRFLDRIEGMLPESVAEYCGK